MINIFNNKKNIIIFVIAILILVLLLIVIFFAFKNDLPKYCFNDIQDGDEQGIDCGGSCLERCDSIENLEILWTKKIPNSVKDYHLLSLVKNPNALYGASSFSYRFIGLNSENKVVLERQGEDFILPGEDKYLFELNIENINEAQNFDLEITNLAWQRFSSYKKPTLLVINKEIKNINEGGFNLEVSGRLINDSIYSLRTIGLKVVLFDEKNNAIAFNRTYLGNIRSREKRDFHVFWKTTLSQQDIKRIDIRPETNVFQEENFVKDYNYKHVDVRYENEE